MVIYLMVKITFFIFKIRSHTVQYYNTALFYNYTRILIMLKWDIDKISFAFLASSLLHLFWHPLRKQKVECSEPLTLLHNNNFSWLSWR